MFEKAITVSEESGVLLLRNPQLQLRLRRAERDAANTCFCNMAQFGMVNALALSRIETCLGIDREGVALKGVALN
jgi:hypothetical protein